MNSETEKAMWSCKTSDTSWAFSSLLKKAVCAVLPDTEKKSDNSNDNKKDNYLLSVLSYICDSNEKEAKEAMVNPSHPLYRDYFPVDDREWNGSPYKTPE